MRSWKLIERNLKEVWRDPVSLSINLALPVGLFLLLSLLAGVDDL